MNAIRTIDYRRDTMHDEYALHSKVLTNLLQFIVYIK